MTVVDFNKAQPHILGQPLLVQHVSIHVVAHCNCQGKIENKTLLILVQGVPVLCQQCKTVYTVKGIRPDGSLDVGMQKIPDGPINE